MSIFNLQFRKNFVALSTERIRTKSLVDCYYIIMRFVNLRKIPRLREVVKTLNSSIDIYIDKLRTGLQELTKAAKQSVS